MNSKIDQDEFVIKVDDLSELEKAKILYNHIWHSKLDESYIDELYKEKRYIDITKHKNFNPRLIEFITDIDRLEGVSHEEYWEFIKHKLDNPVEIWNQTFDHGSDDYMRNLVILTVFNGNKIEENELLHAYSSMNQRMRLQNYSHASKDFSSVIKSVVKYFLNRTKTYKNTIEYSLFNPSIADFIINRYGNDEQKLIQVFLSLQTLESLKVVSDLHWNKKISDKLFQKIIIKLYEELKVDDLQSTNANDFAIRLFCLLEVTKFEREYDESKKIRYFKRVVFEPVSFTQVDDFLFVLTRMLNHEAISLDNFRFLIPIIEGIDDNVHQINLIIEFLKDFRIDDEDVISSLNGLVHQHLVYALDGAMADIDIDEIDFDHDYEGNMYLSSDIEALKNDIFTGLINEIDEFEKITIDECSIKNEIDTSSVEENLVNAYFKGLGEDENYVRQEADYANDIDDLFER